MDYVSALLEQNESFVELIQDADLTIAVPACPGWNVSQLLRHNGRGDRWAAQIVGDRMDTPLSPRDVRGGKPPEDLPGTLDWLRGSSRALIDAVAEVGDVPVWTFLGPRPASWWIRRRLHEWTVHRADAAFPLGLDYELSPELAADGLSEFLGLLTPREFGAGEGPLKDGATLHLHATDDGLGAEGEWLITGGPNGFAFENAHAKADIALRGRAVDLLLVLYRRIPVDSPGVQLFGDAELLDTWLERTGF